MRFRPLVGLGLLASTVLFQGQPAAAAVLYGCANNRSGRVSRIGLNPPVCSANQTPTSWNQSGPAGPPGPSGGTGAPGATGATGATGPAGPGTVVKDASGATMGVFVFDRSRSWNMARNEGGRAVGLLIDFGGTSDFFGTTTIIFFQTSDCTGPAFITNPFFDAFSYPLGETFVVGLAPTLYYQSGPFDFTPYQSRMNTATICTPESGTVYAAPTATEDLSGYVHPFHIEVP